MTIQRFSRGSRRLLQKISIQIPKTRLGKIAAFDSHLYFG